MKNYAMGNSNPEAYITKSKQRVKQFGGTVYLNDGDNFEVEIFNPTSNHILAKISMNGKTISNAGLVIRPGERVFLERHIETNNKFVYSTYEVNGNNKQVQKAIAFNGLVKVEFFNESVPIHVNSITTNWPVYNTWTICPPPPFITPNIFYQSSGENVLGRGTSIGSSSFDTTLTFTDTSNSGELPKSFPPDNHSTFTRKTETGTIEKGEISGQKFSISERSFKYNSFHNIEWHILPKSQQPITSKDINKQYCTECGGKITKSTFKFCPNCGNKLE